MPARREMSVLNPPARPGYWKPKVDITDTISRDVVVTPCEDVEKFARVLSLGGRFDSRHSLLCKGPHVNREIRLILE